MAYFLGSGEQFRKNLEPEPDGPTGQLYDLQADPGQTTNLWSTHPEVVAELTAFHEAHIARGSSFGIER